MTEEQIEKVRNYLSFFKSRFNKMFERKEESLEELEKRIDEHDEHFFENYAEKMQADLEDEKELAEAVDDYAQKRIESINRMDWGEEYEPDIEENEYEL